MAKDYYLPGDDLGKVEWLNNFALKLPTYAAILGVSTAEEDSVEADAEYWAYTVEWHNQHKAAQNGKRTYKDALRDGSDTPIGSMPVNPTLPAPPVMVTAGVFNRIKKLVARIKKSPGYNTNIGDDLRTEGDEDVIDLPSMKPLIDAILNGGHPLIRWSKGKMSGLKIIVDRGTGYAFLAHDTEPDYLDTFALPAIGQSAVWKYKAIYMFGDEEAGQWSDELVVTVTGVM